MGKRIMNRFSAAAGVLLLGAASASGIALENATMRIGFADAEDGFAVTGIVNRGAGEVPCLDGTADGFWKVFLSRTDATGGCERVTLDHRSPAAGRRIKRVDGDTAVFIWEGLDLPGEPGAVDVRARVKLVGASAEWTLALVNRSRTWTATESWYPILARALRPGVDDALIPTMNLGARFVRGYDPVKLRLRGFGSPAWYPMVTAIQRGRAGLYVAAHDGEMRIKSLEYLPDGTLQFDTPFENAGVPGQASSSLGYSISMQGYEGDWWTAAQLYRNWALRQKWTAKGPMASRADYPKAMANVDVWGRVIAEDGALAEDFQAAFPGLQTGIRWYCWENERYDTCYPELTPRSRIAELFAAAKRRGSVVMPYVNGRLWDLSLPSFRTEATRYVCRDERGEPFTEKYAADFGIMCPAVSAWQEKLLGIGRQMTSEFDIGALYYDQVSCASWRLCRNAAHGHPTGGGSWWTDGYRRAFTPIHAELSGKGQPIASEGACEAWMDLIDGALIVGRNVEPDDVPFYPAVYSGYTTYFCIEQRPDDAPDALFARQAQGVLWGCVTGSWDDRRLFHRDPALRTLAAQADVIRRVARFRHDNRKFLAYGCLQGELKTADALPTVSFTHLPTRGEKSPTLAYSAVLGSVWKSASGDRTAYFAANVSDERRTVRIVTVRGQRELSVGPHDFAQLILED